MGEPGALRFVEKPPHVDPRRISDIDDAGLIEAVDGGEPTVDALLARFAGGDRRRPLPGRAAAMTSLSRSERASVIATAEEAARDEIDFTDGSVGRSGLYAIHYLTWTKPWLDAYLLTGERGWAEIWGRTFRQWYDSRRRAIGGISGLDVIWYTLGVASRLPVCTDALDTCGDELSADLRSDVLRTILGGCRWLADEHSEFRPGNWQFVGACMLLRTAALFPEFRESAGWAECARARVEEHLALDVYADGGHSERSPGYHLLCLNHLRDAVAHARAYLGVDLTGHPTYVRMHDWLELMSTPEGWVPPMQDSPPLHVPTLARDWNDAAPGRPSAGPASDDTADRPLHSWLRGSGYVVSRSGWTPGDLYSLLNCGPVVPHELESHSHRAALDFVLWGHGVPLVWEGGGPVTYDDPAYHTWYQSASAHSTVLVDDRIPAAQPDTRVDLVAHGSRTDVFCGSHVGWGRRHRRTFVFVRPGEGVDGYWFVADRLAGSGTWRWRIHGRTEWIRRGPTCWSSAETPGILVHSATEGPLEWETSTGPTRYPLEGEVQDGALHALDARPGGRRLSALLVPVRDPAVTAPELTSDGADLVLRDGETRDVVSERTWLRTHRGETLAAVVWLGGVARDPAGLVLAAAPAESAQAGWSAEQVRIDVRATGRCTVRVRVPDATRVAVRGVEVPLHSRAGLVVVDLPEAGDWPIVVHRTPGGGRGR